MHLKNLLRFLDRGALNIHYLLHELVPNNTFSYSERTCKRQVKMTSKVVSTSTHFFRLELRGWGKKGRLCTVTAGTPILFKVTFI